jgi:hypothetical protein
VVALGSRQAYLDGELCGVRPDGITSFSMIQMASDRGNAAALVFFLFDLLYVDGEDLCTWAVTDRKAKLAALLAGASSSLHYCDHQIGHGRDFHEKACGMGLEGIVLKRADAAYAPGIVDCGSRSNAGTARNLSWSAGPIRKARARISAPCCSPITIPTGGWSMRPRRHRHEAGGARAALAAPPAACD